MVELKQIISEALFRYFNALKKLGYISDRDVEYILLLCFLQDFLEECYGYVTSQDITVIYSLINCMASNSCLIDFLDASYCFSEDDINLKKWYDERFRETEWEDLRRVERTGNLRIVNGV